MLKLKIGATDGWDEALEQFVSLDGNGVEIELEHSLVSLSKWESEFQKPFLESKDLTAVELFAYVRVMLLTPVDDEVLAQLTEKDFMKINDYIGSEQTAAVFPKQRKTFGRSERITADLIYYWMVANQIPWEAQYWHLNRLFALIKICGLKNSKPQKMSRSEQAQMNRDLNAERKAKLGTQG